MKRFLKEICFIYVAVALGAAIGFVMKENLPWTKVPVTTLDAMYLPVTFIKSQFGNPSAQHAIADIYLLFDSPEKAAELYTSACEKNYAPACNDAIKLKNTEL